MYKTINLQINQLYTFYFIKKHILLIVLNDCKIIKPPSVTIAQAQVQVHAQTILLFKLYYVTS